MRKTKIICTLGPATDDDNTLTAMLRAGMNVARLNFSHGTHEEHAQRIERILRLRRETGAPLGILLDTKGPEIRIGTFADGKIRLSAGQLFTLTTQETEGTSERVWVNYPNLPSELHEGARLLIDDGLIAMTVVRLTATDVICRVENSAPLSSRKSINLPGIPLRLPYLSERDRADLRFGAQYPADFIAASFVRSADDIRVLKTFLLEENLLPNVRIIAKIENREGFDHLSEILDVADGIMIARGDMGVEVPFSELPQMQKRIIKQCISRGRLVITATQMLDSMTSRPRPTRAEVSDVANAVYDGTGAVMLSGETSVGHDPAAVVQTMAEICVRAEQCIHYARRRRTRLEFEHLRPNVDRVTAGMTQSTVTAAETLDCAAIVAITDSGRTPIALSSYRPEKPLIGAAPDEQTFHRLSLYWGILPLRCERPTSDAMLYRESIRAAVQSGLCRPDDLLILTAGMPVGEAQFTNTIRVHRISVQDFREFGKNPKKFTDNSQFDTVL